ncbi:MULTISPECIES: acylphosphatase [Streptomyces]|uniref:Acylphosphatase n=1 Tax=Streptomyces fimbriatus TaxID=68197 RepID=A0ABW0DGG4_STRFI
MTVWRFEVCGTVRGVGFRPFVHRTASVRGLDGRVPDTDGLMGGEVAGDPHATGRFAARLDTGAPPPARVRKVRLTPGGTAPGTGFRVRHGAPGHPATAPRGIPPHAAIRDACPREPYAPVARWPTSGRRTRTRAGTFPACGRCRCAPRPAGAVNCPPARSRRRPRSPPSVAR